MKKKLSVIISVICIIVSLGSISGTLYYAKNHNTSSMMQQAGGTPPSMPSQGDNSSQDSNQSNSQQNNESNQQGSSENSNQSTNDQSNSQNQDSSEQSSENSNSQAPTQNGQAPSGMPGQDSNGNQQGAPGQSDQNSNSSQPSMPGQNEQNSNQPGQMNQDATSSSQSLSALQIVIISVSALVFMLAVTYLIMSKFGTKTLAETFYGAKPTAIYAVVNVVGTILLVGALVLSSNALLFNNTSSTNNTSQITTEGVVDVSDSQELSNKTLSTTSSDESAIVVNDGGSLNATGLTISKSGDSSNTENSEFYGLNAAVLVQKGSEATIKDTTIKTNATGANAIFSTGENATINVSNTKITTTGDSSRGLDATYGGTINANKVTINTSGQHCAAVATDRGEGTVTVKNSTLNTNGKGSPCVYSTGTISVSNSKGTATDSSCAVIEGKNSITLKNTKLTSYGVGRVDDGIDNCGVMIYQSMSGDASEGTGTFSATDSTLTISKKSKVYETSPMFFITNTDAVINLENTKLNYGSNQLVTVSGNDGEWGNQGSNGGNLTFNATNQTLNGNISVDNISTASFVLKSSTLTSTINSENNAKEVNLSLDSSSKWVVTGDSYVTTLTLENNDLSLIEDNGYTIYYDASANSWLNGQTITLSNGGTLTPMK
ncbi:MAG: hypothetical protein Q4Q31_04250 [Bacillota bacterium]|nr:hypothetical protein [Bacillota bacterium]